jgi:hypothetical protein
MELAAVAFAHQRDTQPVGADALSCPPMREVVMPMREVARRCAKLRRGCGQLRCEYEARRG